MFMLNGYSCVAVKQRKYGSQGLEQKKLNKFIAYDYITAKIVKIPFFRIECHCTILCRKIIKTNVNCFWGFRTI